MGKPLAQEEDVLGQVAFLDKLLRPKRLNQFLLRHHPFSVIYKVKQKVERLPVERNGFFLPSQSPLAAVDLKLTELHKALIHGRHRS